VLSYLLLVSVHGASVPVVASTSEL